MTAQDRMIRIMIDGTIYEVDEYSFTRVQYKEHDPWMDEEGEGDTCYVDIFDIELEVTGLGLFEMAKAAADRRKQEGSTIIGIEVYARGGEELRQRRIADGLQSSMDPSGGESDRLC